MTIREKILVIEDEKSISHFISTVLNNNGYEAMQAQTGEEALSMISSHCPDLIILDLGLPDMDGLDILRSLRSWSSLPVVVVSARSHEQDKVSALDLGADDYLPKPFHLAELIARVKSVIRRNHHAGATYIEYGNIRIDPDHFQVFVAGTPIELNRKEYDILLYFIQRPDRVINKMTLAESVWGDHIDQVDNFDFIYAQVKNLRKKLTEAGANAEVKAVYGFGYKMSLQAL